MTNTSQFIKSFIIVPLIATTLSMNTLTTTVQTAFLQAKNARATTEETTGAQEARLAKAAKIDAYFAKYNLPLAGYGMTMVLAAEKHGIDPYLIPAIAMRESTGCKFIVPNTNNCFGWGGGTIKFASMDIAIEQLAAHLAGNIPATAHYYGGKDLRGILETYNPPSVVATYADQVMSIMKSIEKIAA